SACCPVPVLSIRIALKVPIPRSVLAPPGAVPPTPPRQAGAPRVESIRAARAVPHSCRLRRLRVAAAHQPCDRRGKLAGIQRLGQVLVEAGGERNAPVLVARIGGERDRRDAVASRLASADVADQLV